MNCDELNEILHKHSAWLRNEANAKQANLRGANLREADLREANLSLANLRWANLSGANLRWADLRGANLRDANLRDANLRSANLSGADLREANLRSANLSGANLSGAVGFLSLPVSDPRGYHHHAIWCGAEWRIRAGCRDFSIAEAREHWLSDDYDGPTMLRETMSFALDWLDRQPKPEEKGGE
jgi:hypothetical protein